MYYWIIFSKETGQEAYRVGTPSPTFDQAVPESMDYLSIPRDSLSPTGAVDFEKVKEFYSALIDQEAEKERSKHITSTPGQMLEYARAYEQALAYQTDPTGTYPAVEANVTAGYSETMGDSAALIIQKHEEYNAISDQIRLARLTAKKAISDATNYVEISEVRF